MLKKLMENSGPCLSTELTKLLIAEGLSEVAARQRVSRGFPGMNRLTCLPFPKKAKFLYLQKDYGTSAYYSALEIAIMESNSATLIL